MFLVLRLLLGTVFLYASYDKILHSQAFAQAVYNYQILPDMAVNLTALVLPWLELLLGLCLVTGFWLPGATVASTGLLLVFIGALVFNQVRGLDIHCGCFSTETTAGPADLWTVARDIGFLAVSVFLYELTERCTEGKNRCVIRVENTRSEKGFYADALYIRTDSKIRPMIPIYITGMIQ